MPLRFAQAKDISDMARVFAAAFHDEEMMGGRLHPHRQEYPNDYRRYWENKVTEWYWDYSHQLVVTYTSRSTAGGEEEVLTGVGDWIRRGQGWERHRGVRGTWDPRTWIKNIVRFSHQISSYLHPNRAADLAMHCTIFNSLSYTKHLWSGRRGTGWYLNFLGVDPAYQKQGYGRLLATWGVEEAKKENVTASVISGTGKDRFYGRCGFDTVAGNIGDGDGNPLKGMSEGGNILFWDPKGE